MFMLLGCVLSSLLYNDNVMSVLTVLYFIVYFSYCTILFCITALHCIMSVFIVLYFICSILLVSIFLVPFCSVFNYRVLLHSPFLQMSVLTVLYFIVFC